jgi:hypothetical protein
VNKDWPTHNVASAVVESMRRHVRKPSDYYPTPAAATVTVLDYLGLPAGTVIAEPACGQGAIARVCRERGYYVAASDLRETGYGMGGCDYLTDTADGYGDVSWFYELAIAKAIITNPPFNLAEAFIRKAVQQVPVVAMLLKSNFFHAACRTKLWDDCTPTAQLPVSWRLAFLEKERGKSPLMDCTWFVWDRSKPPLKDRPLVKPTAGVPDISVNLLKPALVALGEAVDRLTVAAGG